MGIYSFEGLIPVVDPSAYVHPDATLIGDVVIGPECYIGPGACLRGDFGRLSIERGSNIQDGCILHSFPEVETRVGEFGHIGHGAVLHACQLQRNVLVGMNSVVMDKAVIGENSIIGAMSFIRAGFSCPANSLVTGSPASVKRELSEQEREWKLRGTGEYQLLAQRSQAGISPCTPLSQLEDERPTLKRNTIQPLHIERMLGASGIIEE